MSGAADVPPEVTTEMPSARRAHRMPVGKARKARVPDGPAGGTASPETAAGPEAAVSPESTAGPEPEPDGPPEQRFAVRKPVGVTLKCAAAAAAAVFIAAGAFAGATVSQYLVDRALVETKLAVAQTAADAVTAMFTYRPDNLEGLGGRASRYLGGDFAAHYRNFLDGIVAPNKQAQVSNSTQVLGAAVESVSAADATAIIYTNTTVTSPLTKNIPTLRYVSYRLTLRRDGAQWRVTKLTTVTSLNLTPQL